MTLRILSAAALALALAGCAGQTQPASPTPSGAAATPAGGYDVVIANGRIVDGTGDPWFYGDVAIAGDRIVRITPAGLLRDAPARRRIDARGLVVAPGVIDIQAQSYSPLLFGDSRVVSMITQGVTTMILGEGDTPAPANERLIQAATAQAADTTLVHLMRGFTGEHGFDAWLRG
ncbi:MAG TPA: hypothetical protein VF832_20855, partial [Longimicrobiales bacterium]